jgi:16S rRNA (guanine527-N7)-methyltransferase
LKGEVAATEAAETRERVLRLGGDEPIVRRCGVGLIDPPTTVIEVAHIKRIEA